MVWRAIKEVKLFGVNKPVFEDPTPAENAATIRGQRPVPTKPVDIVWMTDDVQEVFERKLAAFGLYKFYREYTGGGGVLRFYQECGGGRRFH